MFEAEDGEQRALLSPCAGGGRIAAPCAVIDSPLFQVWLDDAPPSSSTFLELSMDRVAWSCGSRTLIADPFSGLVLSDHVDTVGESAEFVPSPMRLNCAASSSSRSGSRSLRAAAPRSDRPS